MEPISGNKLHKELILDAVKALGFDDPYSLDAKYDFVLNDKTKESLLPEFSIPMSRLTANISDSLTKFIVKRASSKNLFFLRATPITSRVQYNGHHDYGWQDGPMIPNKGMQYYLNAGIYGNLGPLEFQYSPDLSVCTIQSNHHQHLKAK